MEGDLIKVEGFGPTADRKYFVNKARERRRLDGVGTGKQEGFSSPGQASGHGSLAEWALATGGLEEAIY